MASVKFPDAGPDSLVQPPGASFADGHDAALKFAETVGRARAQIEMARVACLAPAIRALRRIETRLRRPLRLALMGEFNSGKSTLANLIIGNAPLPTLQLSNTKIPTLIHYSSEPVVMAALENGGTRRLTADTLAAPPNTLRIQLGMPMQHLLACEIVDFPGFSDPWLSYGAFEIGRHPVDAAIWCTFSTQAWKESENAAWHLLPARIRAASMLAVTSKDLLSEDQSAKVMARLRKATSHEFTDHALLSAVQGRNALDGAGAVHDPELWRTSGAADFYESTQRLLSRIRQRRLDKAKTLTSKIAGAALAQLATETAATARR